MDDLGSFLSSSCNKESHEFLLYNYGPPYYLSIFIDLFFLSSLNLLSRIYEFHHEYLGLISMEIFKIVQIVTTCFTYDFNSI